MYDEYDGRSLRKDERVKFRQICRPNQWKQPIKKINNMGEKWVKDFL